MAEPFLSEIRLMSFNFRAEGLGAVQRPASCRSTQNQAAVLAARHHLRRRTGASNFGLPDLRGRAPIHGR